MSGVGGGAGLRHVDLRNATYVEIENGHQSIATPFGMNILIRQAGVNVIGVGQSCSVRLGTLRFLLNVRSNSDAPLTATIENVLGPSNFYGNLYSSAANCKAWAYYEFV